MHSVLCVLLACTASSCNGPTLPESSDIPTAAITSYQGFGADTEAGDGGVVIHVENLLDSGAGSLREALEHTSGKRTIVFDVGGVIRLRDDIAVRTPFVTVDGFSAPIPGITLRGFGLKIRTHDVRVSHIRIHVTDEAKEGHPEYGHHDAIDVAGNNKGMPTRDILIDHCSLYWAIDEAAALWSGDFTSKVSDVTFSNCIFGESLSNSIHPDGPHSCGPLIGYGTKRVAMIRNLIAHCADRTPNIQGGTETVIVNNVIYDPWKMFIHVNNYHGVEEPKATIIGNVCIRGPSRRDDLLHAVRLSDLGDGAEIHVDGNLCGAFDPEDPWASVVGNLPHGASVRAATPPVWDESIAVLAVARVESFVLDQVGARPHNRDEADSRLVAQVRARTGGIIDSQREVENR